MNEPHKLKVELAEIIRLCQLAIAKQNVNGDAYVLLANAYHLAAMHTLGEGRKYFLPRAAAVIHEWRANRLPTKNWQIGEEVHHGILKDLDLPVPDWMNMSVKGNMSDMHAGYYHRAISPDTIAEVRQVLVSE